MCAVIRSESTSPFHSFQFFCGFFFCWNNLSAITTTHPDEDDDDKNNKVNFYDAKMLKIDFVRNFLFIVVVRRHDTQQFHLFLNSH